MIQIRTRHHMQAKWKERSVVWMKITTHPSMWDSRVLFFFLIREKTGNKWHPQSPSSIYYLQQKPLANITRKPSNKPSPKAPKNQKINPQNPTIKPIKIHWKFLDKKNRQHPKFPTKHHRKSTQKTLLLVWEITPSTKEKASAPLFWGFEYCGVATYFLYITKRNKKKKLKKYKVRE